MYGCMYAEYNCSSGFACSGSCARSCSCACVAGCSLAPVLRKEHRIPTGGNIVLRFPWVGHVCRVRIRREHNTYLIPTSYEHASIAIEITGAAMISAGCCCCCFMYPMYPMYPTHQYVRNIVLYISLILCILHRLLSVRSNRLCTMYNVQRWNSLQPRENCSCLMSSKCGRTKRWLPAPRASTGRAHVSLLLCRLPGSGPGSGKVRLEHVRCCVGQYVLAHRWSLVRSLACVCEGRSLFLDV